VQISHLGEFPLIDRIARIVSVDREDVIVGIGDDVAVLDTYYADSGGEVGGGTAEAYWTLAKVDCQVEGVHFLKDAISPRQLGRKALIINLSDIAAIGGQPLYALVSLALPDDTEVAWVDELYHGLREEGDRHGVAVVGGNMARSTGGAVVDVFVLGRVRREQVLLRSGARPGDRVLVTGRLGDSAAGLQLLLHRGRDAVAPIDAGLSDADRAMLLDRHFTPTPRLREAQAIAAYRVRRGLGAVTAVIDLSDGLSSDLGHICDRSEVGARVWADRLPISLATRSVAREMGREPWQLAIEGGEDYELCFTAPAAEAEALAAAVERETGTPVSIVGEILPPAEGRRLVLADGREGPLEAKGWQHW
jgi:thiamine-monophosphate kinase